MQLAKVLVCASLPVPVCLFHVYCVSWIDLIQDTDKVAVSRAHCNTLLGSGISGRGGELLAVQEGLCSEGLCILFMVL